MSIPLTARDIMTTDVITIQEQNTVMEAAQLMLSRQVSSLPVVSSDFTRQLLVGFVSEKDVMQCYASAQLHRDPGLSVAQIMRPHPVSVRAEADIYTLAAIFMQHGFRHLPVAPSKILLGIVSRRDVLRALMRDLNEWQENLIESEPPDLSSIFTPRYVLG